MNFKNFIQTEESGWHINAESNKDFARKLMEKLEKRLDEHENCERNTRKERHAIFSQCFEEIIRHNSCFGPLLSEIKQEYENCIGAVLRAERDADFVYRNLTSCISGLGTLKNYKEQIKDLEKKYKVLIEQNLHLKQNSGISEKQPAKPLNSANLIEDIKKSLAAIHGRSFHCKNPANSGREFGKFRVKVLERYTPSEQMDVTFLNEELRRLRKEIQELIIFFDKRFKWRKTKYQLVEKLVEKEQAKNDLMKRGNMLKAKLLKLEETLKEERKQRDLVMRKKPKTVAELILLALKRGEAEGDFIESLEDELTVEESSDEEDQLGEQEQEEMVEYMEKFEDLFTQGFYEEAATVAATSPQDILRTAATFERFKEQRPHLGEKSPLLYYCEAVIVSSGNPGQKGLSTSESVDVAVRALEEHRQELVIQWLSQNKLKYSDLLGDSIAEFCTCAQVCACGCYTLAEAVYRQAKAHGKVVSSLCRQGRLHMAVHHARNVAKFRKADFMRILREYPSSTHAKVLLLVGDGYLSSPLCREECITSLVHACRPRDAMSLLKSAHDRIQSAKIIPYLCEEQRKAWNEFCEVLLEQRFMVAVYDVMSAWVLTEVFSAVKNKIGL